MKSLLKRPTEFLKLDIGGGVVMDAFMIAPSDFDPSKKYPVLVYVYGEPHAQTVLDRWGTPHADYHRAVAELGYLVVSIDNRGTPAPKGAAWRRAVAGSLGPLSTEEQAEGLKELARTRPYVDLSRVGIWGWSGGGSNTLNAMYNCGNLYSELGRHGEGLPLLRECLAGRRKVLVEGHPDTQKAIRALAQHEAAAAAAAAAEEEEEEEETIADRMRKRRRFR